MDTMHLTLAEKADNLQVKAQSCSAKVGVEVRELSLSECWMLLVAGELGVELEQFCHRALQLS